MLLTVRLCVEPAQNKPMFRKEVAINEGEFIDVFDMNSQLKAMFG